MLQQSSCYCSEEPDHLVVEGLGSVVGLVVIHEGGEVQLAGHLLGFLTSQPRPDNSLSQGRIELGDISLDFIVSFLKYEFLTTFDFLQIYTIASRALLENFPSSSFTTFQCLSGGGRVCKGKLWLTQARPSYSC